MGIIQLPLAMLLLNTLEQSIEPIDKLIKEEERGTGTLA